MTICNNQGLTVTVLIKDERIQKDGLYALEVDELLWNQADLQIKPTLVRAEKQGEVKVITDIQNPCLQKFRLHQRDIGRLVRVEELNEQELEEVYFWSYKGSSIK